MPVQVDFKNLRFETPIFVAPDASIYKGSSPAEEFVRRATDLVVELQRVGWDVPFVDVRINHRGDGKLVLRHCSEISFEVTEKDGSKLPVTIGFDLPSSSRPRGGLSLLSCASSIKAGDLEGRLWFKEGEAWRKDKIWTEALRYVVDLKMRLAAIDASPGSDVVYADGDENLRSVCSFDLLPPTEFIPESIYVWVKDDEAWQANHKVDVEEENDADYAAKKDYVLVGNGWRFAVPEGDLRLVDFPKGAHAGGQFASVNIDDRAYGINLRSNDGTCPVEVKLRDLNDVYVYDMAGYERAMSMSEEDYRVNGNTEWRKGEREAIIKSAVDTFVAASDYPGGYEKPWFMIARQLHEDEARPMRGPISVMVTDEVVEAMLHDESGDVTLYDGRDARRSDVGNMMAAVREAEQAARMMEVDVSVSEEIEAAIEEWHETRRIEQEAGRGLKVG